MRLLLSFSAAMFLCFANLAHAEDVLRFRGGNSQGNYPGETGLLKTWPEGGPKQLWLNDDLGEGWTSVIKVRDRLYLGCLDSEDAKKESVVCLDLDGKPIWQTQTGTVWERAYPFPRTTPTFVPGEQSADDRLVVLSGGGVMFCLDANDGKEIWQKNLAEIYETKFGVWGLSESVVVKDGVVFATVCGNKALAVALKLENGDVVWETPPNGDQCAYVTPIFYGDQLIIMTVKYITSLNVKTGEPIWRENYQEIVGPARNQDCHCITPLLKGNKLFVTSGFGQGGVMFEIAADGKSVETCWVNKALDTYHGGVVEVDGRIYGSDFRTNWLCLDWETGETVYNETWANCGKGSIITADGMLYMYDERRGMFGLAKPADTLEVVSSFPIEFGSKEHWPHPVISDGILYIRRGKGLAAYDIREKQ